MFFYAEQLLILKILKKYEVQRYFNRNKYKNEVLWGA